MFLGGPFVCGGLLLASLVVLFFEALFSRLPRWLIAIPVAFFGYYYSLYYSQEVLISKWEAELQSTNPVKVHDFNANQESLVFESGNHLVSGYRIPVTYNKDNNHTEGYISYRIITKESCDRIPQDSEAKIYKSTLSYRQPGTNGRGRLSTRKGLCLLRMPEQPSKEILEIRIGNQKISHEDAEIGIRVYTFVKKNKEIGAYRTASIGKYYGFPLPIIGCGLNSSNPSWDCVQGFQRSFYRLKSNPISLGQDTRIDPVAQMLGLKKYSDEDYLNFVPFLESNQAILRAQGIADDLVRNAFDTLRKVFGDRNVKIPWRMLHTLTRDTKRIDDNADNIVRYLSVLQSAKSLSNSISSILRKSKQEQERLREQYATYKKEKVTDLHYKQKLMFSLLAWISEEKFHIHAQAIFRLFSNYEDMDKVPDLYLRLADTSEATDGLQMFYENDLNAKNVKGWSKFLPVQALCRIGTASSSVIKFMKTEFEKEGHKPLFGEPAKMRDNSYYEALFLALVSFHEQDFARAKLSTHNNHNSGWYTAVLDGKAAGQFGPNNCMIRARNPGDWTPPSLQPKIKRN